MAILPIIKLGHPTLRKRADEITVFDDALYTLADNMVDTMIENEGIGLAGPQVNILQRIFVIDLTLIDEDKEPMAYINPVILDNDGQESMEEGCLSIPDLRGNVNRPTDLTVRYQTLENETVTEKIDGLLSRVFQHELDHLDGVMFIDKLSPIERKLLEPQLQKIRSSHSIS